MPKRQMPRHTVTQPLDPSYRLIPLTRGQNAIVDAADFEEITKRNWQAQWSKNTNSFYAVSRNRILMHRQILGCTPKEWGDHKNHDTLDNRRSNLRKCTRTQNARNGQKRRKNKSGFKGVSRSDSKSLKWISRIRIDDVETYLGSFGSLEDAARAYDKAAMQHHGEFAHLNFPH